MQGETAKPVREVDPGLLNVNEDERHKEKARDLAFHKQAMVEEKKKQTLAWLGDKLIWHSAHSYRCSAKESSGQIARERVPL